MVAMRSPNCSNHRRRRRSVSLLTSTALLIGGGSQAAADAAAAAKHSHTNNKDIGNDHHATAPPKLRRRQVASLDEGDDNGQEDVIDYSAGGGVINYSSGMDYGIGDSAIHAAVEDFGYATNSPTQAPVPYSNGNDATVGAGVDKDVGADANAQTVHAAASASTSALVAGASAGAGAAGEGGTTAKEETDRLGPNAQAGCLTSDCFRQSKNGQNAMMFDCAQQDVGCMAAKYERWKKRAKRVQKMKKLDRPSPVAKQERRQDGNVRNGDTDKKKGKKCAKATAKLEATVHDLVRIDEASVTMLTEVRSDPGGVCMITSAAYDEEACIVALSTLEKDVKDVKRGVTQQREVARKRREKWCDGNGKVAAKPDMVAAPAGKPDMVAAPPNSGSFVMGEGTVSSSQGKDPAHARVMCQEASNAYEGSLLELEKGAEFLKDQSDGLQSGPCDKESAEYNQHECDYVSLKLSADVTTLMRGVVHERDAAKNKMDVWCH